MKKEIRKVKIGMDGIRQDKKLSVNYTPSYIAIPFMAILFVGFIIIPFTDNFVLKIVSNILLGLMAIALAINIFLRFYNNNCIEKGNFTVKKDRLVDISVCSERILRSRHKTDNDLKLEFSTCIPKISITGKSMENTYCIIKPTEKYYKWSVNEMEGNLVGNIGDEYYLIFLGKNKNPSMIYNTRYFYIEGDENE